MKLALAFMSTLWGFVAFAEQESEVVEPNAYECQGENVRVSYTTTSFIGQSTYSVSIGDADVTLGQFEIQQSPMGTLVYAYDKLVTDATRSYTLIIPRVFLADNHAQAEFDTQLIETTNRNSLPRPHAGVLQNSTVNQVSCTARIIWF